MFLAKNNLIPPREWMHSNSIKNKQEQTLQDILKQQHLPIPLQWKQETILTKFDQACFKIIPNRGNRKATIQNQDGFTIAMILTINRIQVPEEWYYKEQIKNIYGETLQDLLIKYNMKLSDNINNYIYYNQDGNSQAMIDAIKGFIPKLNNNDPEQQNKQGQTVAMLLIHNNIIPPKEWIKNTGKQYGKKQQTIAMILVENKLNIPDYCYHDPEIQDSNGNTLAMYMIKNNLQVPKQLQHNLNIKNKLNQTLFDIAIVNKLIPQQWICNNAQWQDKNGNTQAMILAQNNIEIPDYFYHNPEIQNNNGRVVAFYLIKNNIDVPKKWQIKPEKVNKYNQTLFEICCANKIQPPSWSFLNSQWKNQIDYTQAMMLAENNLNIPKQLCHQPNIQNKHGFTVAMFQACNGIIPDKYWQHDKQLRCQYRNKEGEILFYTVQNILQNKNIHVPEEWNYDNVVNQFDFTQAMLQAKRGRIPDSIYYHNPLQVNIFGNTVEDFLISKNSTVPKEWQTNSDRRLTKLEKQYIQQYCNHYGIKVNYSISPTYNLNNDKNTIAMYLAYEGIVPPSTLMHDIYKENKSHQTVQSLLYKYNYIYLNNQFVYKYQTHTLEDKCQVCQYQNIQEFVISKCNHKICLECFKRILKHNDKSCPICKRQNWYSLVDRQYYEQNNNYE